MRHNVLDAQRWAAEHFGFEGHASELPGECDGNFRLESPDGARAVLKIAHLGETRQQIGRASCREGV